MAHDVFISHSSRDKLVADAVCFALEAGGVRCWIAPRDVPPGRGYSGEITRAIRGCRVMVLVFSSHSNESRSVLNEVEIAHEARAHIINFRVEDAGANDDLQFYLRRLHWLDAITPPMERYHAQLLASVRSLLNLVPGGPPQTAGIAAPAPEPSPAPLVPDAAPERHGLAQTYLDRASLLLAFVENAMSRPELQGKIAAAQARGGDLPAALRTVQGIEKHQESALGKVAAAQAQAGHVSGALATAAQFTTPIIRANAQIGIAAAQARAGDIGTALSTAMSISHDVCQANAIGDIAVAQTRAGSLPAALETVQRIADDHLRAVALVKVTAAQAQMGDFDGALRVAYSIHEQVPRAKAFASVGAARAQSGDIPAALRAAESSTLASHKADILYAIALTQARNGDITGALCTAAGIDKRRPEIAARAIGGIAAIQVLQGDLTGAEKTVGTLALGYPRVFGYVELANRLLDETLTEAC